MKNQYVRLFSFLFGVAFILSGVVFTFTRIYKDAKAKEKKEESIIADEIGNVYDTFYDKADEVNEFRNNLLKEISEYSSFYSNMQDKNDDMSKMVAEYEARVIELEDISSYLKDNCTSRYSILEANKKCDAYYINLEKAINVFIGDVSFYNSKIDEYNEWIVEENKSEFVTDKYEELTRYEFVRYKEYVDLNNDGTYLGMNAD